MINLALIIPISKDVDHTLIDFATRIHNQQTIKPFIIFSHNDETPFNLSKARNRGAKLAKSIDAKWLAFTDLDTFYNNDLLEKMIAIESDSIAGKSRGDVETLFSQPTSYYHCGHAPLIIKRSLFESIGGYCESYSGWGFDDSDAEHKLDNLNVYDSKAYHVLSIHRMISSKPEWKWGSDDNRIVFEKRMTLSKEERIINDRLIYNA